MRSLNSQNSELRSQLEVLSSRTRDNSATPDAMSNNNDNAAGDANPDDRTNVEPAAQEEEEGDRPSTSSSSSSTMTTSSSEPSEMAPSSGPPPPLLPPEVAVMKLEQKFKEAMGKCADLSFEKERLEHIVVQLQEETDTVGQCDVSILHQSAFS